MGLKDFIKKKLSEGSTWSGIGALIVAINIPHADDLNKLMPTIGLAIAGLMAIYFP